MSGHRRQSTAGSSYNGSELSSELKVGARVQVQGKSGTIRYAGTTSFQTGKWIGIELDDAQGKNSGVVQGKRYFDCKANHGVFVRPSQVRPIPSDPVHSSSEEGSRSPRSPRSDRSLDSPRFAVPHDPGLAAARSVQQRTPSPSSTLLPSRISAPTRISRLHQKEQPPQVNTGMRRPTSMGSPSNTRAAAAATAASLAADRRKSVSGPRVATRQRSSTLGQRDVSDVREKQLQQLRLQQQQRILQLQKQQQQQQQADEQQDTEEEEEEQEQEADDVQADAEDDEEDEDSEMHHADSDFHDPSEEEEEEEEASENEQPDPAMNGLSSTDPAQSRGPQTASYGSLAGNLPVNKFEQMIPMKDYEELRLKLKILESKRQEDREKYREHEKVKEEAEQFLTLRNKLQDKIAELQKELRDTKRQLKETTNEKESFESKYNDVIESLEMMTVDKEMAEERAENLQQEAMVLKDKIEEISVDLDVLRKEADILNRPPTRDDDEKAPLEVVQLEHHNERLKQALRSLRDATKDHEAELNRKIKILEKENYELDEFRVLYERTKEKLDITEMQIEDLKHRLDDALGAEDLVEQLTEKNLNLNEKLEEMRMAVEDLEALKELADELEENHIETEKQLQAEIDHRDMLLREQLERLRSSEETNVDYESTIQQFRELVLNLQSDLEQLRHKEENEQTEKRNLSSQSQAMMSLNMQLQSTVMKAQAKAIDLELRKLEAAQANDRLSYIQPYLPHTFFKSENDPISCLLLFKRLVFKSELMIKHLDQNHPISEKLMDTVSENLVSVCEMKQRAGWLSDLAKRFVTYIKHCKPESFTKMGQVYHDLVGTERRLNGIVELMRTDELNETECLTELQRIIAQLEHLTEVYLVQNGENNHADQFFGLTRALDLNADRMIVELTFVKQAAENACRNEGVVVIEGLDRLDFDYLEPLGRLIVQSKGSKIIAKKLLRQLEDLSEQALTLKAEHLHRFKMLYAISSKLSRFCFETYKQIAAYIDTKRGSKEDISLAIIQQMIYNKADEILEIAESSMWEGCLKTLKSLHNELGVTLERVENDNKMEKIATGVAPWVQRASDMKAEVVVNHDMERKLQQHSEEILKLIKDIKLKDQALQESGVKVELLEKRMETVKKQAVQITQLEENLHKAQTQEQMYAEAMENLQAEYDALEQENIELKKTAVQTEEKTQSAPKKSEFDVLEGEASSSDTSNYHEVTNQMEALKGAIRYLRAENAHLKSCDMARTLGLDRLPDIVQYKATKKEDADESSEVKETEKLVEDTEQDVRDLIRSFALETRVLVKDMRAVSASPKVVQLSAASRGGKWQSMKKVPDYQYQTQQSVLYTLKQRGDQLRHKMEELQRQQNVAPATPKSPQHNTIMTLQQSLNRTSALVSRSLARIQIPQMAASGKPLQTRRCIQLQSAAEFERIHSAFLR